MYYCSSIIQIPNIQFSKSSMSVHAEAYTAITHTRQSPSQYICIHTIIACRALSLSNHSCLSILHCWSRSVMIGQEVWLKLDWLAHVTVYFFFKVGGAEHVLRRGLWNQCDLGEGFLWKNCRPIL